MILNKKQAEFATVYVNNPDMNLGDISREIGVHRNTITNWLNDKEFVESLYQTYMQTFGAKLPSVLQAMYSEAINGNVQAGRLILEHSGKLVKNVEVKVESPFERFLQGTKKIENAIEVVEEEKKLLSNIGLLSIKPKIIVCNVDEGSLGTGNKFTQNIKSKYPNEKIVNICADIEDQIMGLNKDERENFMKEIGMTKTGLNQLIKEGYELLNLNTFFTSGPEESKAWTIKKETLAPKAASVIHTDFEKNFIRAEAITYEHFIKYGSSEKCKENGKLRVEGKDYIVKDGDVLFFRVNP